MPLGVTWSDCWLLLPQDHDLHKLRICTIYLSDRVRSSSKFLVHMPGPFPEGSGTPCFALQVSHASDPSVEINLCQTMSQKVLIGWNMMEPNYGTISEPFGFPPTKTSPSPQWCAGFLHQMLLQISELRESLCWVRERKECGVAESAGLGIGQSHQWDNLISLKGALLRHSIIRHSWFLGPIESWLQWSLNKIYI